MLRVMTVIVRVVVVVIVSDLFIILFFDVLWTVDNEVAGKIHLLSLRQAYTHEAFMKALFPAILPTCFLCNSE